MSAFVVSDKHISAIVQAVYGTDYRGFNTWRYLGDPEPTQEQAATLAKAQQEANILMQECHRSVAFRYKHHADVPQAPWQGKVKLDLNAEPVGAVQALKLIQCLDYQSCETDDWDNTTACKLLDRYRRLLVSKLPGYDDCHWAI